MKLKHIFTGIALLCFALSACGAKTETAEATTAAVSSTEVQKEEQTKEPASETAASDADTASPAGSEASVFSAETSTPPIYTDTESFITTESQYFTDLGYTPETKYVNKYRAKLIISGKDDFELLNTVKQWAKDRNIELEDKTSGSEIKVYCTGSKNYDDGSSIDMAFASTSDNARINLVFFLADPAADQFLADAENVMSSLGIQASSDVGNKASDEGATIAAYDPRANVSIAWSISSLVDENVDKALELCFKWGETFGIPMDDFKIEKANSFLYKASTSVEKGGDKYEIYCYVNDSSKQVLAHIFLYEAAAEQK